MRSQVLSPALCLFIAIFISCGHAFSKEKSMNFLSKTTDNKTIKSPIVESDVNDVTTFNAIAKESFLSNNTSTASASSEALTETLIRPIEEFSYNYIESSDVGKASIASKEKSNFEANQTLFRNGMFYGFALMVILLNLVCYFLFDEKIFMFYSFALSSVIASFMYSDSLFEFIGISGIDNVAAMQSTLLLLATACGALFASRYLSHSELFPKIKWIAFIFIGLASMMVFSSWISENLLFTGIANAALLTVMGAYFWTGMVLFSKKNYAKFYVIACSIPLLFSVDFFVLKSFGIDFLFTESFHLKAATLFEMLIITYAIMYRMRAIKEEHLLRQTEMRIFLKRQEVINRTNTEKLMQDMYLENLIMQHDLDGLEIKLLQYISEGKDNAKIARKLKTTEDDIEDLTKELYDKLHIGEQIQEDYRMVDTQPDYIYN